MTELEVQKAEVKVIEKKPGIEFRKAFAKFQSELVNPPVNRQNKFHGNRYADLAQIWDYIRKPLTDNGFSVIQLTSTKGKIAAVKTTLMHTSGDEISGILEINCANDKAQTIAGGITYARRYSLQSLVGVVGDEDDDGNYAQQEIKKGDVKKTKQTLPKETQPNADVKYNPVSLEMRTVVDTYIKKYDFQEHATRIHKNLTGKPFTKEFIDSQLAKWKEQGN